jgi:hypothetical protein
MCRCIIYTNRPSHGKDDRRTPVKLENLQSRRTLVRIFRIRFGYGVTTHNHQFHQQFALPLSIRLTVYVLSEPLVFDQSKNLTRFYLSQRHPGHLREPC